MTSSPLATAVTATPEIFLSGQQAPPGVYRSLFTGREFTQSGSSCLPRQRNGAPTLYVRLSRVAVSRHPKTKSLRHSSQAKES
jgi:hypothetical protein